MESVFEGGPVKGTGATFLQNLSAIFGSSIILDDQYIVRSVSRCILELLGYEMHQVVGKSVSILSQSEDLVGALKTKSSAGYFHEYHTFLCCALNRNVFVNLSGFHSHKINTNENDYLVLQVMAMEERGITELRLVEKSRQLESLLHCAWHDLRGPIATIKGLVALARIREDDSEVSLYFDWIGNNAEALDKQLKTLLNLVHNANEQTKR